MTGSGPKPRRDRNPEGRPQNARPRDAAGRPLPRDAQGDPTLVRDPEGTPEELLDLGIEHFNAQRYFQAHEAWETAWHPSPGPERDFWQGITQIAVGFTHRARGNANGAVTLLRRGSERCEPYLPAYKGIDLDTLVRQARQAADVIETQGTTADIETPSINRV
jgi:uncharacterized protein